MNLPEALKKAVDEIRSEHIQGASWSLLRAAKGIMESLEENESICSNAEEAAKAIVAANPTMVTLEWVSYAIIQACRRGGDKLLETVISRLIDYQMRARERLVSNSSRLLEGVKAILTYSYSSSVELVLRANSVHNKPFVLVLESYPGGEGVYLASRLKNAGFQTRLVPDVMMYEVLEDVDAVLVGADAVTLDGCLFNKIGTSLLACAANDRGKPLISVFDSTKISPQRSCSSTPRSVRSYEIKGYGEVTYPLFDSTPIGRISGFVTERGFIEASTSVLRDLVSEFKEYLGIE